MKSSKGRALSRVGPLFCPGHMQTPDRLRSSSLEDPMFGNDGGQQIGGNVRTQRGQAILCCRRSSPADPPSAPPGRPASPSQIGQHCPKHLVKLFSSHLSITHQVRLWGGQQTGGSACTQRGQAILCCRPFTSVQEVLMGTSKLSAQAAQAQSPRPTKCASGASCPLGSDW